MGPLAWSVEYMSGGATVAPQEIVFSGLFSQFFVGGADGAGVLGRTFTHIPERLEAKPTQRNLRAPCRSHQKNKIKQIKE